jgi:formate dehydrogenase subunit gamma
MLPRKNLIQVTTGGERLIHWLLAVSCIILLITGLGLMFKAFEFLTLFLGGYKGMKLIHNYTGLVFTVSMVLSLIIWYREGAILKDYDIAWIKKGGGYLWKVKDLPEAGRFNAGQKIFFILVIVVGALMFITGIIMWFSLSFPHALVRLSYMLHALGVVTIGGALTSHIFLGTANPGSFQAMMHGYVTRGWVKLQHPRWLKEVEGHKSEAKK